MVTLTPMKAPPSPNPALTLNPHSSGPAQSCGLASQPTNNYTVAQIWSAGLSLTPAHDRKTSEGVVPRSDQQGGVFLNERFICFLLVKVLSYVTTSATTKKIC